VEHSPTAFVGTPFDPKTRAPLLTVDLGDLEYLPTADQVRTWAPDSSWAWTRCEALGHELAEAIEYARLHERGGATRESEASEESFAQRFRQAHTRGLLVERTIATAQRTRLDEHGSPYGRGSVCFADQSVLVTFGPNTESFRVVGGDLSRAAFFPGSDMCAGPW
jgi:hypothetical protein